MFVQYIVFLSRSHDIGIKTTHEKIFRQVFLENDKERRKNEAKRKRN